MKTLIIFISMLFCVSSIFAQINYFSNTKTFNNDGYTYQCDVGSVSKYVSLYNKTNKWIHSKQVYKDTGKTFVMPQSGIQLVQADTWTYSRCKFIVDNALTVAEKQRVRNCGLSISMYINPDTGKIDDVLFNFVSIDPLATIPISVYRKIETNLKQQIWFTPTSEGKKLNYIFRWWMHDFK